jgi:hypothetical protein
MVKFLMAKGRNYSSTEPNPTDALTKCEGIFGKFQGDNNEVENLKKAIAKGFNFYYFSFCKEPAGVVVANHTRSSFVVAEVLRAYLASLQEPLLTFSLYDAFLVAQSTFKM